MGNYKVIERNDYQENKIKYLDMIKELFFNDDNKLANYDEINKHLDFIFSSDNNKALLIMYIENNKIISMVNFLQYDNQENKWVLFSLFTKNTERHKGYGYNILKYSFEVLRKYNVKYLLSGIEKDNIPSIKLHLKLGFNYTGKKWDEIAPGFPSNHDAYLKENL